MNRFSSIEFESKFGNYINSLFTSSKLLSLHSDSVKDKFSLHTKHMLGFSYEQYKQSALVLQFKQLLPLG
jgi:hypothetical protein